ncbi:MAG: endopeptidase La [Lachnospiraceae bacterium]|nr:endopeptidase La [Lachnospiraceae bacterium]
MAVLPIYHTLAIPDTNIYLKEDEYKKRTGRTPIIEDKVVLILMKDDTPLNEITSESFFPIGLTGQVSETSSNGYIVIHTHNRVNLDEITIYPDHSINLSISNRADIDDIDREDIEQRLKRAKSKLVKFAEGYQWAGAVRSYVANMHSLGEIAAALSPWIVNSVDEQYAILATDSLANRADLIEKMIYENIELVELGNEAKNAQEEDYQKIYRESAIKKQMEYLQKELDQLHPEEVSDIRRLELAIEESGMNEEARKEADKVLRRLKQEREGSESAMLHDYLDLLTKLPWKKETAEHITLKEARDILDAEHSSLKKVKKRIIQQIAVMSLKKQQSGSILLFVGAPGTGKTSIGKSIAHALHRKYVRVSLGGVRDEADIRGHRRTYIGSMPGRIIDGIAKSGVSNPVMVLDEIDKLSTSYNGDPASALLEVLDPEQNSTFTDHYLNVPYDLSDVLFICTANSLDTIPEPLLNRMEVIQYQGYTPTEKKEIARMHLIPKALEASGINESDISITDEALDMIITEYTKEAGVRGLKKRLDTICRSAAVNIVGEDTALPITITPSNVRDYLDMNPLHERRVSKTGKPGIITGLAWTSAGGDILYIESMLTKGKGETTITGQLGDVMKESAQIAVSLVKSYFPEKAVLFKDHDLHIHVPDGATPKDGPSAGITLTTALASMLTDTPVSPEIAMTGEVSLQGKVKPIGGLPEKLLAAQRAGVKRVFIPIENVDDLRDVAQEVKDALTITPVSEVSEVLEACGIIGVPYLMAV